MKKEKENSVSKFNEPFKVVKLTKDELKKELKKRNDKSKNEVKGKS